METLSVQKWVDDIAMDNISITLENQPDQHVNKYTNAQIEKKECNHFRINEMRGKFANQKDNSVRSDTNDSLKQVINRHEEMAEQILTNLGFRPICEQNDLPLVPGRFFSNPSLARGIDGILGRQNINLSCNSAESLNPDDIKSEELPNRRNSREFADSNFPPVSSIYGNTAFSSVLQNIKKSFTPNFNTNQLRCQTFEPIMYKTNNGTAYWSILQENNRSHLEVSGFYDVHSVPVPDYMKNRIVKKLINMSSQMIDEKPNLENDKLISVNVETKVESELPTRFLENKSLMHDIYEKQKGLVSEEANLKKIDRDIIIVENSISSDEEIKLNENRSIPYFIIDQDSTRTSMDGDSYKSSLDLDDFELNQYYERRRSSVINLQALNGTFLNVQKSDDQLSSVSGHTLIEADMSKLEEGINADQSIGNYQLKKVQASLKRDESLQSDSSGFLDEQELFEKKTKHTNLATEVHNFDDVFYSTTIFIDQFRENVENIIPNHSQVCIVLPKACTNQIDDYSQFLDLPLMNTASSHIFLKELNTNILHDNLTIDHNSNKIDVNKGYLVQNEKKPIFQETLTINVSDNNDASRPKQYSFISKNSNAYIPPFNNDESCIYPDLLMELQDIRNKLDNYFFKFKQLWLYSKHLHSHNNSTISEIQIQGLSNKLMYMKNLLEEQFIFLQGLKAKL